MNHTIETAPSRYDGEIECLTHFTCSTHPSKDRASGLHIFSYVPPGREFRKVFEGSLVTSVGYLSSFQAPTIIAANPAHSSGAKIKNLRAENRVIDLEDGDTLVCEGQTFKCRFPANSWGEIVFDLV